MKWKVCIGVIIILLLAVTASMWRLWQKEREESSRQAGNVESLCAELKQYKIRDSLNVAESRVLRLKVGELEDLRSAKVDKRTEIAA